MEIKDLNTIYNSVLKSIETTYPNISATLSPIFAGDSTT